MPERPEDRPLPSNHEAERAVLGAVLLDNSALAVVRGLLSAEDFHKPEHVHIFGHMIDLHDSGVTVDLVTLTERLHVESELEMVGGAPYLSTLVDGLPRVSNVEHYAKIVKEKAALRHIIHLAENLQQQAFNAESVDTVIQEGRQAFDTFAARGTSSRFFDSAEDLENAPPLSFLIDGFLQRDAITALAGLPDHGKTMAALSITRALLLGPGKLWGLFPVRRRLEKALYLIPESTRGPLKHRLELFGIFDEVRSGRLLVRTLNQGPIPRLTDPELLRACPGALVVLDTGVRFLDGAKEKEASEIASGLSVDMQGLLRAGAAAVLVLFHSPKSLQGERDLTLENMIRGSGELGAVLESAWGIRQLDKSTNRLWLQCLKAHNFEPSGAFQLEGRPHIDRTGDFALYRSPDDCGDLADELPSRNKGGASQTERDAKATCLEILRQHLASNPDSTNPELQAVLKAQGFDANPTRVRQYRFLLRTADPGRKG